MASHLADTDVQIDDIKEAASSRQDGVEYWTWEQSTRRGSGWQMRRVLGGRSDFLDLMPKNRLTSQITQLEAERKQ